MPLELDTNVIEEKNNPFQDKAFITLLKVSNPYGEVKFRVCQNTEDVYFNGETYLMSNFELGQVPEATDGNMPSIPLKVQNVDRILGQLIEQDENFGSDWVVEIRVIHEKHIGLTPEYAPEDSISHEFVVTSVSTNHSTVTLNLGIKNPLRIQFPRQKFNTSSCQRTFDDGRGCPYSTQGKSGTNFTYCTKTLEACTERFDVNRKNSAGQKIGLPFLGFNGLASRAIIKV